MDKYMVVLERKGQRAMVVLSALEYEHSTVMDKANNIKMHYGSGARWTVLNVMDYEAYQNQTDSKPF